MEKRIELAKTPNLEPLSQIPAQPGVEPRETLADKAAGFLLKANLEKAFPKRFSAEKLHLPIKEKIFFLDAFGSLVNAGIPIVRALQIIYFQSRNVRLRELSLYLKREIEGGANMAKTASTLPRVFTPFDVAMFEMGEATGKIGRVLEIVTEREEKSLELSRKVKQALIYPVAIAFIAVGMIAVIMTYVVPKIEGIYREANANLPGLTSAVIGTSRFVREYGIVLLAVAFVLATVVPIALKNPAIRLRFDEAVLRIPVFGTIMRKKILVSFCEFLGSLLSSGIVINRALTIVKAGVGNKHYEREIEAVLQDVKTGKPLSSCMGGEYTERKIRGENIPAPEENRYLRKIVCFPIELSTAVKVGEQTGTLARMLEKASARYNREIDSLVKNLSSMLEPAVIVGVGGIVGTIVLAIMLPFFNMVNVVR